MQFDAGAYYFLCVRSLSMSLILGSYVIANGVVYMSAEEREYPKKLSLAYLEEVRREYEMQYGSRVRCNISRAIGTVVR